MKRGAAAVLATLLFTGIAGAQTLYKWVDAQGRVQYSDRPPKDAKIPVTKIEPDIAPTREAAKADAAKGETAKAEDKGGDSVVKRRAVRAELWAALIAARDKLDAARKALAEAAPSEDERQVIQQRFTNKNAAVSGMHGLRSNCREVTGSDGKKMLLCPALVANEAYHERVRSLEEAVAQSEVELAAAEQAYRRGVD